MESVLKILAANNRQQQMCLKPLFYRLVNSSDRQKLEQLLNENKGILVHDEILGQVEEFVKSITPKTVFSKPQLTEAALKHIGNTPQEEYGVWVFYPWSNKLVHILDEAEFVTVRTNRNQYKITPAEKEKLATKKIGILGLSVGQSIALTLAMERGCGELRIADFDILELSNLNRIRTGVQNLGIPKTVAVAREIAEIDPYFKVTCFHKGANEENIDEFITSGGKLDILVDECDGLAIKILCRQKAKEHRIPVVMDTADRGMIDVERFDLEPNRSILHGYIDHLDISKVKEAKTNEEKVPYLLPMLGLETVSTRMKASMLEIEQTITTWPQLASSVVLGGGMGADVCRRILLDQYHESGRYFVDVEQLVGDTKPKEEQKELFELRPSITLEEMEDIIAKKTASLLEGQIDLSKDTLNDILTAATLAPTGANIQPWKWIYKNKTLYMFFDDRYSAGLLDCGNTTSFVGLGCATENLVLKAHELGLEVIAEKEKLSKESKLICSYRFFNTIGPSLIQNAEPHVCDELAATIPHRLTNRNITKRVKIEYPRLENLKKIAQTIPGADLILIDDPKVLDDLRDITAVMDRIRVTHKGGHKDYLAEIRWTPEQALEYRNGVDLLGTVDLTPSELAGWQVIKDWKVIQHLNDWRLGKAMEKIQKKSIDGSSAVGLLTIPEFSCDSFYEAGRAFERVWLAANRDHINVHPASLSTLIFNTYNYGDKSSFPDWMKEEVAEARKKFEKLFSIKEPVGEVILFRFFIGGPPKSRSVRYHLKDVLNIL
jgi:molybdopterin/thiamine biosynthesis adenylyltransferase